MKSLLIASIPQSVEIVVDGGLPVDVAIHRIPQGGTAPTIMHREQLPTKPSANMNKN